jgi:hypothetical protein
MRILEDNEYFTFWEEDGIICFSYKQNIVTLDIAKLGVEIRLNSSGFKPKAMFVDLRNIKTVTKEARDYYTSTEAIQLLTATAVLTESVLTKTIVTFFLNFNKPKLPFRMFTNKGKAFAWLKEFEEQEFSHQIAGEIS